MPADLPARASCPRSRPTPATRRARSACAASRSEWYWDLSATYGRNTHGLQHRRHPEHVAGPEHPAQPARVLRGHASRPTSSSPTPTSRGSSRSAFPVPPTWPSAWSSGARATRSRPARRAPTSTAASATSSATRRIPGAQVFAGWRPSNERDESRHNFAAYVDVEGDVLPRVRLGLAGRVENYSDFGTTADGKITRALQAPRPGGDPRRGQHRLPRPVAGPVELLGHEHELPEPRPGPRARRGGDRSRWPASPRAALGATDLKPEESTHLSAGLVLTPLDNFDLTVDYYRIDIDDRIVLSGNFTDAAASATCSPPSGPSAARASSPTPSTPGPRAGT